MEVNLDIEYRNSGRIRIATSWGIHVVAGFSLFSQVWVYPFWEAVRCNSESNA